MRVLIDTSVLSRALLALENPARAVDLILAAAVAGAFDLLIPAELLIELSDLLTDQPYFATRVTTNQRMRFLQVLEEVGTPTFPSLGPFPRLTRDPDDDYLLAFAIRDGADILVTGDHVTGDHGLLDLATVVDSPSIVDAGRFGRHLQALGRI